MHFLCGAFILGDFTSRENTCTGQTYDTQYIRDPERHLLRDTVQNMLRDIDRLRTENRNDAKENMQWLAVDDDTEII